MAAIIHTDFIRTHLAQAALMVLARITEIMKVVLMVVVVSCLSVAVIALYLLTVLAVWATALDDVGSGAYLAFVTILVYTVQAVLLVRGQRWKLLRLIR